MASYYFTSKMMEQITEYMVRMTDYQIEKLKEYCDIVLEKRATQRKEAKEELERVV